MFEAGRAMYGRGGGAADVRSAVQSTIDDAVAEIRKDTEHRWAEIVVAGSEEKLEYCNRCGRRKEDLRLPNEGYLPCRGFVG
jgi:hypothetical protein